MTFNQLKTGLEVAAYGAVIATAWIYFRQMRTMQAQLAAMNEQIGRSTNAVKGQNFFSLVGFLQSPELREARRCVLEDLANRPFPSQWTQDDIRAASAVCSSYDAGVISHDQGLVERQLFADNWGPSVDACYRVLKPFILERQAARGPDYWDDLVDFGEARQVNIVNGGAT